MYKNNRASELIAESGCILCGAPKAERSSDYCDSCDLLAHAFDSEFAETTLDERFGACIYVIGAVGDPAGPVKIGFSTNVLKRLRTLQTAHHQQLEVIAVMRCRRGQTDEKRLHAYLKGSHERGEWYRRTPVVSDLIRAMLSVSRGRICAVETSNQ